MWFSAIKLALNAGTHIYKKKQEDISQIKEGQVKMYPHDSDKKSFDSQKEENESNAPK